MGSSAPRPSALFWARKAVSCSSAHRLGAGFAVQHLQQVAGLVAGLGVGQQAFLVDAVLLVQVAVTGPGVVGLGLGLGQLVLGEGAAQLVKAGGHGGVALQRLQRFGGNVGLAGDGLAVHIQLGLEHIVLAGEAVGLGVGAELGQLVHPAGNVHGAVGAHGGGGFFLLAASGKGQRQRPPGGDAFFGYFSL